MTLADLLGRHLEVGLLTFFRMGAMLTWAPVTGQRSLPLAHRAGLSLLLAVIVTPGVSPPVRAPERDLMGWALAIAGEIVVGLAIAFIARLVVAAVEIAGDVLSLEMGLSIAAVFDPGRAEQETIVARLLNNAALLLFLVMNGHHVLIRAVAVSLERIKPGAMPDLAMAGGIVSLGGKLIQSGVALAGPVVAVLVVANVVLALVGRAVPQTNVFLISLPVSIGLGLLGLCDALPAFAQLFTRLVTEMRADLDVLVMTGSHGLR